MGFYASADLRFGLIIQSRDSEEYEPTQFWNEDTDDWIDLGGRVLAAQGILDPYKELPEEVNHGGNEIYEKWKLENPEWRRRSDAWWSQYREAEKTLAIGISTFGHYDDDEQRAILCVKSMPTFDGDTYDAVEVDPSIMEPTPGQIQEANECAKTLGLDVDFCDARWWLVASYG